MQFSAGSVFTRSIGVSLRNFIPFLIIGLIIYAPVIAVQVALAPDAPVNELAGAFDEGRRLGASAQPPRADPGFFSGGELLDLVLGTVAQGLLAASLAYATFRSLQGERAGIGEAMAKGFGVILPVIGASILLGIVITLGLLVLIVPGVILACMYYVAIPAIAVERIGVGAALARSALLTRGHRGSIFVLFLLLGLGAVLLGAVLLATLVADPIAGVIASGLISAVFGIVGAVAQAVAYHDLRVVKEGVSTSTLVAVFD